jgi:hypothetical protein
MAVKSLKRSTVVSPSQVSNSANAGYSFQDFHHLETVQLGADASSVTFANLDKYAAEYKHLQIRSVARMTYADVERSLVIRFNSDSGTTNYYNHGLYGQSGAVGSYAFSNPQGFVCSCSAGNATSGAYGAGVTDILDAFNSTKNKVARSFGGSTTTAQVSLRSFVWLNTTPITSITLLDPTSNLVAGSRFSLYGIR